MNVILILADQLSAKWLGCYGNPAAATPHLDRLARRGALFETCVSNLPVCMAARASMITGRSAQHHGVFYNGWELGLGLPTYPQLLRQAGVRTCGIGKFHHECHGRSAYNDVRKYGFDAAQTTEDIRAGEWLDWVGRTWPEHYDQALSTCWPMPHLKEYGPDRRDLNAAIRAAVARHPRATRTLLTYPSVVPEAACQTQWVGNEAVSFLESCGPEAPFYLQVSFVDPHDPYDPPERFLERIDPDRVPAPVRSDDPALGQALRRFDAVPFLRAAAALRDEDWRVMRRHYLASVAFIDDQVGRIGEALQRRNLERETLLVFAADHGDMLGDHGLLAKGAWHFDACWRVPLLIAGPGVIPHRESQAVSLLDLFPTVTDYAGAAGDTPVEGTSLRPLLECCGPIDRPDAALVETYGSYGVMAAAVCAKSVVTPAGSLTLFGDGAGMLFDRAADPQETTNLFGSSRAARLEAQLRGTMCELLFRQNALPPNRGRHPTASH
jgi:arylsulfatase